MLNIVSFTLFVMELTPTSRTPGLSIKIFSIFDAQLAQDIPVTLNTNSFLTEPSPEVRRKAETRLLARS